MPTATELYTSTNTPVAPDVEKKSEYSPDADLHTEVGAADPWLDGEEPTDEEYATLRKVPGPMKWTAFALCIVEIAERASYYGSKKPFANFVRGKLPKGGNGWGAVAKGAAGANQTAGALGMGSVAASGVTSTFTFLSYLLPILGGVVADTKWGRFKTICVGVAVGAFAHILLVVPAIPSIIAKGSAHAFPPFIISVLILAFAAGFIKPCLAPLLFDQSPVKKAIIKTTKSGERVIVDPQTTTQRYSIIFYWCINIGSFWMIVTSYSERLVGFWLAFLEPVAIYILVPVVFLLVHRSLYYAPPTGSVVADAYRVLRQLFRNNSFFKVLKGGDEVWDSVKPSRVEQRDGVVDEKIVWDDTFVDDIRQTLSACAVSFITPIFYLADGGIGNMENDQSAAMTLNSIPNDLFGNFNPLTIIILSPIMAWGVYPFFQRIGYPIKPMTRLAIGFLLATANMTIGAIVQWKVYQTSPCGYHATDCDLGVSTVNLVWQIPLSVLPGAGEVFIATTAYELAYTRAPARMKTLVTAIILSSQAVSSAISLALTAVITDPYLIWPYVALAIANFICAGVCLVFFRKLNDYKRSFADPARLKATT